VKLPPRSPNLNAHAERFVRSIKECCLDRLILFGESSLRTAVQNFVAPELCTEADGVLEQSRLKLLGTLRILR
jgi:hypothetical protein